MQKENGDEEMSNVCCECLVSVALENGFIKCMVVYMYRIVATRENGRRILVHCSRDMAVNE